MVVKRNEMIENEGKGDTHRYKLRERERLIIKNRRDKRKFIRHVRIALICLSLLSLSILGGIAS
jgi:hypothetical protein